jgi:hypothetical protein
MVQSNDIWFVTNWFDPKSNHNELYSTNISNDSKDDKDIVVYVDGYIVPRISVFEEYRNIPQENLIKIFYRKFGLDFIHYIKGVFVLIIFENNNFFIFNDRHSIKKYFIYEEANIFFISNSLRTISDNFSFSLDRTNVAIFSLISHFLVGQTMFKNVTACRPAECVAFDSGRMKRFYYWHPRDIIKKRKIEKRTFSSYAWQWKQIINGYLVCLNPKGISLTLTGGNDSRMVLAALLSIKSKFHTFTFGNPHSYDGEIVQEIKNKAKIPHSYYVVENPTSEWFRMRVKDILSFGNSLVNIHRAHRYEAVTTEKNSHPETEILFTGLVGGEYLKEPAYNNITIPVLFKNLGTFRNETECCGLIARMLQEKGLDTSKIDVQSVYKRLQAFLDHGKGLNEAEKKFVYTYLFYGCAHHTQDANVFGHHIRYVVNPFMDIDFLELIAGYKKWYVNRKQRFFHKAFHSELLVGITDNLAPELSVIPYAKKGKYTANDLLKKKGKYILKRLAGLISRGGNSYPPNFPMGSWLYDFCDIQMAKLNKELLELYDLNMLKRELESVKKKSNEENWHIVTNPININLNYEYYQKI